MQWDQHESTIHRHRNHGQAAPVQRAGERRGQLAAAGRGLLAAGVEGEYSRVTLGKPTRHVIYPDGFAIPREAARIHGITTELALQAGDPIGYVLEQFQEAADNCQRVIAHNVEFDVPVLGAEFLRRGLRDPLAGLPATCTMKQMADFCKLPGTFGFKWPRLDELHFKLFGRGFDGAHSAEADVVACAHCYQEARRLGLLTEANGWR